MPFSMPPGLRIPYDSDGTIGILHRSSIVGGDLRDIHPTALRAMNSTMGAGMFIGVDNWDRNGDAYDYIARNVPDKDPNSAGFIALLLPVPTRLRGIFASVAQDGYSSGNTQDAIDTYRGDQVRVEVSKDTTNGLDGTWNLLLTTLRGKIPEAGRSLAQATDVLTGVAGSSLAADARPIKDYYRNISSEVGTGIQDLSGALARNVRGIRFYPLWYGSLGPAVSLWGYPAPALWFLHLYGEPDIEAAGENYLQAWRTDSDMRLGGATLSWGDVALGSSADKSFRIKNQSATHTANSVVLSVEDLLFYPTPSLAAQFLLSLDSGDTWGPTATLSAIGPGTVSSEIQIRRVTPTNSPLTSWSPKIRFDVGSWS